MVEKKKPGRPKGSKNHVKDGEIGCLPPKRIRPKRPAGAPRLGRPPKPKEKYKPKGRAKGSKNRIPAQGRNSKGHFAKGNDIAKAGKGIRSSHSLDLARAIMDKTKDLSEVVQAIYEMAMKTTTKNHQDAMNKRFALSWLTEYSVGKPKIAVESTSDTNITIIAPDLIPSLPPAEEFVETIIVEKEVLKIVDETFEDREEKIK